MTPEASLRYWFDAVDTDRAGQLSTEELQRALINGMSCKWLCQSSAGILGEGYLRLSYANSTENILKALARMGEFLAKQKAA